MTIKYATPSKIRALNICRAQSRLMRSAGFQVDDFSSPKLKFVRWRRGDIYIAMITNERLTIKKLADRIIAQTYYTTSQKIRQRIKWPTSDLVRFNWKNE